MHHIAYCSCSQPVTCVLLSPFIAAAKCSREAIITPQSTASTRSSSVIVAKELGQFLFPFALLDSFQGAHAWCMGIGVILDLRIV